MPDDGEYSLRLASGGPEEELDLQWREFCEADKELCDATAAVVRELQEAEDDLTRDAAALSSAEGLLERFRTRADAADEDAQVALADGNEIAARAHLMRREDLDRQADEQEEEVDVAEERVAAMEDVVLQLARRAEEVERDMARYLAAVDEG
jgi:phage shock protein A